MAFPRGNNVGAISPPLSLQRFTEMAAKPRDISPPTFRSLLRATEVRGASAKLSRVMFPRGNTQ